VQGQVDIMLTIFCSPSRYVQGRNATESLGSEMKKLGLDGPAFILAGPSARKNLEQIWAKTFQQEGIKHSLYDFGGECSRPEIEKAKQSALLAKSAVIIGSGGGKVLDAARAVASELNLPVVNCPTVASSDAPCSALSVVYTADGQFESYLFYKKNPDLVLVDTTVISRAPARLLVAGMGDALATWFEARTVIEAKKKNQLGGATTITAAALAKLCCDTLLNDGPSALHAVKNQAVTPALERLVEANTLLSGLGFESGGLAVAHSLHNGLTVVPETHAYMHGEKVAFGLLVQLVIEGRNQDLSTVLNFCAQVGLPTTLNAVGIRETTPDILMKIAQRTIAPGETAHNEPFAVTAEMIADGIRTADSLGQRLS
jgi:glycerol dehydrogenase